MERDERDQRLLNIGAALFVLTGAFVFAVGSTGYFLFWWSVLYPDSAWLGTIPFFQPSDYSLTEVRMFNEQLGSQFVLSVHAEYANIVNSAAMVLLIAIFGLREGRKWAWWVLLFIGVWVGFNDLTAMLMANLRCVPGVVPITLGMLGLTITFPVIFGRSEALRRPLAAGART